MANGAAWLDAAMLQDNAPTKTNWKAFWQGYWDGLALMPLWRWITKKMKRPTDEVTK